MSTYIHYGHNSFDVNKLLIVLTSKFILYLFDKSHMYSRAFSAVLYSFIFLFVYIVWILDNVFYF